MPDFWIPTRAPSPHNSGQRTESPELIYNSETENTSERTFSNVNTMYQELFGGCGSAPMGTNLPKICDTTAEYRAGVEPSFSGVGYCAFAKSVAMPTSNVDNQAGSWPSGPGHTQSTTTQNGAAPKTATYLIGNLGSSGVHWNQPTWIAPAENTKYASWREPWSQPAVPGDISFSHTAMIDETVPDPSSPIDRSPALIGSNYTQHAPSDMDNPAGTKSKPSELGQSSEADNGDTRHRSSSPEVVYLGRKSPPPPDTQSNSITLKSRRQSGDSQNTSKTSRKRKLSTVNSESSSAAEKQDSTPSVSERVGPLQVKHARAVTCAAADCNESMWLECFTRHDKTKGTVVCSLKSLQSYMLEKTGTTITPDSRGRFTIQSRAAVRNQQVLLFCPYIGDVRTEGGLRRGNAYTMSELLTATAYGEFEMKKALQRNTIVHQEKLNAGQYFHRAQTQPVPGSSSRNGSAATARIPGPQDLL